jgi:N-methylhydantoinase A
VALVVALDIGGTFTDLVAFDLASGKVIQAKSSTTPYDLAVGIRRTLEKSALPIAAINVFVHGSTVAINTAIERNGAKTALLVTEGTRDVYQIGRGNRPESYNLFFQRPTPYVPRRMTWEIVERLDAAGEIVTALDAASADKALAGIASQDAEAVAVCFIHAWANPAHEIEVGRRLRDKLPKAFHALSHEILREYREYERTSTTVLNAYVGPRVSNYLQKFEDLLAEMGFAGQLLIMQSNGGAMSPGTAKRIPVATMESGPVGGMIAAAEIGRDLGIADVIAFDMGGTTAKVSLVRDNQCTIAQGYYVGSKGSGHPVMYPVVDIVEVGAGGGSIAWIDEVGGLKVGPRSAGGHPGPVCYSQGGTEPTVTDANLVLGRLGADRFLGGEMPLDVAAARKAIGERIAEPLGLSIEAAAAGIVRIAIAEMALAVQSVSIGRGHDPRDFAMVAFGGAGPLHAVEIARELHIPKVIIPRVPGHFSALGMLLADLRHDYVRTYYKPLDACDFGVLTRIFEELRAEGEALLRAEGVAPEDIAIQCYLDMRYTGQEFPIQTAVSLADVAAADKPALRKAFDFTHDKTYGHQAIDEPVEVVNCRLTARGRRQRARLPALPVGKPPGPVGERQMILTDSSRPLMCAVWDRDLLTPGQRIDGPAAIVEYASSTVLFEGDRLTVAPSGELIIEIGEVTP